MYKFIILSALVVVCVAQVPQDTPEVAQARAAHLAAFADAQLRSLGSPVPVAHNPVFTSAPVSNPADVSPAAPAWRAWDGIPAPIVVQNGHVQDTAEVAAEKTRHFNLVADAAVRSATSDDNDDGQYRHDPSGDYIPASVTPAPVTTPNVYQTSFFPAPGFPVPDFRAPSYPTFGYPGYPAHFVPVNPNVPLPYRYTQDPVVVSQGFVQDTPEVAAARSAHIAQLRAAGLAI